MSIVIELKPSVGVSQVITTVWESLRLQTCNFFDSDNSEAVSFAERITKLWLCNQSWNVDGGVVHAGFLDSSIVVEALKFGFKWSILNASLYAVGRNAFDIRSGRSKGSSLSLSAVSLVPIASSRAQAESRRWMWVCVKNYARQRHVTHHMATATPSESESSYWMLSYWMGQEPVSCRKTTGVAIFLGVNTVNGSIRIPSTKAPFKRAVPLHKQTSAMRSQQNLRYLHRARNWFQIAKFILPLSHQRLYVVAPTCRFHCPFLHAHIVPRASFG